MKCVYRNGQGAILTSDSILCKVMKLGFDPRFLHVCAPCVGMSSATHKGLDLLLHSASKECETNLKLWFVEHKDSMGRDIYLGSYPTNVHILGVNQGVNGMVHALVVQPRKSSARSGSLVSSTSWYKVSGS